jgi:nucleotide-binding universal stress UspA family protein
LHRKIISAVDSSFHSELVARHAVAIASSLGSQLVVLAVDTGEVESGNLSYGVEHLRQHAGTYGIQAKGIIRKGEVVKTILAVINEEHADLLVLATRHGEHRLFVSSITQKLMLKAPCAVLAVKPSGIAKRGRSMLLPLARREHATDELIMLTSSLAKFYSYKVEVLHVIELPRWYDLPWIKLYTMRLQGEENMTPVADALKALGVDVDVRMVVAESSINAIPKEAAIGRHSMALMGASRRGILKEVVYGNPIERMLSGILCDVLIWRQKL